MKKTWLNILICIGIPLILITALFTISNRAKNNYNYSEIIGYFKDKQVVEYSMNLGSGETNIKLKDGSIIYYVAPSVELMYGEIRGYIKEYNDENPDNQMKYNLIRASETSWIQSLIPTIISFLFFAGLYWFFFRKLFSNMGDGGKQFGFGKARFKNVADEKRKTTFKDVAGADEEKEELEEIVEFLKCPDKYNKLGARIPKGVLLVGPPGTGKTLLARAVAGEAGVPFFSISGSDFVEMFVGVGASRVRDLFDQAKKNSPCIVFIDEIDAVGRQRGAGLGGGNDEREQTLNQLLVEMDGFGINEGVIIIAATNRADILDKALTRPGRFDRQVFVGYPDIKGREEILKVHTKNKSLAPDVDLKTIAKSTAGFTGADLENIINEAALLAAKEDLKAITMKNIEESTVKVVVGTEKKSRVQNEHERKLTAFHEAGHAIVTYFCDTQDEVHQISIVPRGMAGGYTMSLPSEDRSYKSKLEMKEDIMVLLGGRIAESLTMGDISTGASNDISRATKEALSMVTMYGMSDLLGPIAYNSDEEVFVGRDIGRVKNYSEETASKIDQEVYKIINECYKKSKAILENNMSKLHEISKCLLEKEKISGEDFEKLMKENA